MSKEKIEKLASALDLAGYEIAAVDEGYQRGPGYPSQVQVILKEKPPKS
jgi:hypothetical protein